MDTEQKKLTTTTEALYPRLQLAKERYCWMWVGVANYNNYYLNQQHHHYLHHLYPPFTTSTAQEYFSFHGET